MPGRNVLTTSPAPFSPRLAAFAAAWLLAASGCGSEPPAGDASAGATPASPAAPAAAALHFSDGRVSVARDQVLQLALLEELAARAGFELVVGSGVAPRSITLRLDDVPLLEAISAMLEGTAFRTEWAVNPGTGAHVLAKLGVGEPAPAAPPVSGARDGADVATERERKARSDQLRGLFAQRRENAAERSREASASAEERRAREAAAIEQLADADAARRAEALESIDPTGDAAAQIGELAKSDPDPRVRAIAVEKLGDADTYQATTALLDSLADPAPQVLIAALEAIEFSGDASLLPRIAGFVNHPNAAVREAAISAIQGLQ